MSKEKFYSTEKNIQIVLSLLKANGIRRVVVSPGGTNSSFVESLQNDAFFELYSCVDERSAAYMACGMAAESRVPVVISCTGSTAGRNYYPGLTEAFYRKLPVLAITSHQGADRIGQLLPQNVDRRTIAKDIARISVELPIIKDERDYAYAVMEANKAVLELSRGGGGPVHINLVTSFSKDFSVKELPKVRTMRRFQVWDELPVIPQGKIGVFIGSHLRFTDMQEKALDRFCSTYDAIVICDHTSGYYGKYKLLPTLVELQSNATSPLDKFDLMIHIGEISAATFIRSLNIKEVWRVSEDGELRDPFKRLVNVFQMSEEAFFIHYGRDGHDKHDFIDSSKELCETIYASIPELPFGNIWIAQQLSTNLPTGSVLHISASNSRRCWNMFHLPEGIEVSSNVGCCGIDGATSSLIGASLMNPDKLYFMVTGDLAFFYDLNVLGNRHVGKNIRILLNNNGMGVEFKLNNVSYLAEDVNDYIAAKGHWGNKSPMLVRHFAEDLGYRYLSAYNKDEFMVAMKEFTDYRIESGSIIFECFVDPEDEKEALRLMSHIRTEFQKVTSEKIKATIKSAVGESNLKKVKSIFKA